MLLEIRPTIPPWCCGADTDLFRLDPIWLQSFGEPAFVKWLSTHVGPSQFWQLIEAIENLFCRQLGRVAEYLSDICQQPDAKACIVLLQFSNQR